MQFWIIGCQMVGTIGISKHLKNGPFDIRMSKHPVFGSPKYTCKNSYHVGCCLGEWGRTFRELANKVRHFLHRYIVSTVSLTMQDKFNKNIRIVIMLNNISFFFWKLTLKIRQARYSDCGHVLGYPWAFKLNVIWIPDLPGVWIPDVMRPFYNLMIVR